jgi:dienelactone hydrolase
MDRAHASALAISLITSCAPFANEGGGTPTVRIPTELVDTPHAPASNAFRRVPPAPTSTWYLNAAGHRFVLVLRGLGGSTPEGTLTPDDSVNAAAPSGPIDAIDAIDWRNDGTLVFRHAIGSDGWQWFRARIAGGVLRGRIATTTSSTAPRSDGTAWTDHVTGWNEEAIDTALVPRTFDLVIDGDQLAMLRIDAPDAHDVHRLIGRLKVYATESGGSSGEAEEEDLDVRSWDGTTLRFVSHRTPDLRSYVGAVTGRWISGTSSAADDSGAHTWYGARADVLGYGLASRTATDSAAWRDMTRRRIEHLIMAGAPAPKHTSIDQVSMASPLAGTNFAADRDDSPLAHPQDYGLRELSIEQTIADPRGGPDLVRQAHAWLAIPNQPAPASGYPAVVALNGHFGGAYQTMDPQDDIYWYGDAFARRGYVVLAVDVSHRPYEDRSSLYADYLEGDDPSNGNGPHPAIKSPGMDSDWEESGERAWDAIHALDVLMASSGVAIDRVFVMGLSMGGEVASYAAALDERFMMAVIAGYAPDLGVELHHTNHPCWLWQHGDVREYLDASDLFALIAPRPLVVETGEVDNTYSDFSAPFASDKQVMRRAHTAIPQAIHFLHMGAHEFRTGDADASTRGMTIPQIRRPSGPWSEDWQIDPTIEPLPDTLFDRIANAR